MIQFTVRITWLQGQLELILRTIIALQVCVLDVFVLTKGLICAGDDSRNVNRNCTDMVVL